MRLIDVDKAIKDLKQFIKDYNLENLAVVLKIIMILQEQPTAFDVDKVISNIWDRSELIHIKHNCYDEVEDYIRVTDVTQIVKVGGMGRDEIFDRNR